MMRRGLNFEMSEESASAHTLSQPQPQPNLEEKVRISFKCQDGRKDYFRVLESTVMHELVQAFCKKRKIEYKTTKFVFAGKKLPYHGTVAQAGLKDQDEIDVLIDALSG